jgi:hypothetical protein
VTGAHVQVEGTDNSVYPLSEVGNGYYLAAPIGMDTATRYRVHISNVNNEEYTSDYVPFKPAPPIDSVTWTYDMTGVNFYAYTHDPGDKTRYYQWKCTETWQLTAPEASIVVYQGDTIAKRTPGQQIDTCWHTDSSANILIGTSSQLAEDVITHQHLMTIPINTEQIGIEYSLLVTQYAITDSCFDFLTLVQKNTEQLGGVMDLQPSQIVGNVHCLTNPTEQVIGFINAGAIQQYRIFINRTQVPGWLYFFECPFPDIEVDPGDYPFYFGRANHSYTPLAPDGLGGVIANYNDCADCRARDGASNQRPSWWE